MSRSRKSSTLSADPTERTRRVAIESPATPLVEALPIIQRSPHVTAIVNWLFPAYVGIIAIGFLIFWQGGVIPTGGSSSDRSLFDAVNAATLTGFPASFGVPEFLPAGQVVVLALMLAGTLFSLIVGGLAVVRICRLAISDSRVILGSIVITSLAVGVGTLGGLIAGRSLFESLFLAVSAFSNTGLVPTIAPLGPSDAILHLLLLPLSILGGLGVTVVLELLARLRGRKMSTHATVTLAGIALAYLIGMIGLLACAWPARYTGSGVSDWMATFASLLPGVSADALNVRSAGFPLATIAQHSHVAAWWLLVLLPIGAGSAGTAGGLKVTTLHQLYAGAKNALAGKRVARSFGIAMAWLGMFVLAIAVTQGLLVHAIPELPTDRSLFLAVSSVSNVGLSHDPISFVGDGLYALSAGMFAGRVLPLLVLWWMADTTTDADVAIG